MSALRSVVPKEHCPLRFDRSYGVLEAPPGFRLWGLPKGARDKTFYRCPLNIIPSGQGRTSPGPVRRSTALVRPVTTDDDPKRAERHKVAFAERSTFTSLAQFTSMTFIESFAKDLREKIATATTDNEVVEWASEK